MRRLGKKERGMGREGDGNKTETIFKKNAFLGQRIDVWSKSIITRIGTYEICPLSIQSNQDKVILFISFLGTMEDEKCA